MKKALETESYAVDVAYDGIQGYDMASIEPYDAIILDVGLLGRDGFTLSRTLREEKSDTPVLMLTAVCQGHHSNRERIRLQDRMMKRLNHFRQAQLKLTAQYFLVSLVIIILADTIAIKVERQTVFSVLFSSKGAAAIAGQSHGILKARADEVHYYL